MKTWNEKERYKERSANESEKEKIEVEVEVEVVVVGIVVVAVRANQKVEEVWGRFASRRKSIDGDGGGEAVHRTERPLGDTNSESNGSPNEYGYIDHLQ